VISFFVDVGVVVVAAGPEVVAERGARVYAVRSFIVSRVVVADPLPIDSILFL
jgi:hypothetical protein